MPAGVIQKLRGQEKGEWGSVNVHGGTREKEYAVCKMSTIVHFSGGRGQNWVKFGPRSY